MKLQVNFFNNIKPQDIYRNKVVANELSQIVNWILSGINIKLAVSQIECNKTGNKVYRVIGNNYICKFK